MVIPSTTAMTRTLAFTAVGLLAACGGGSETQANAFGSRAVPMFAPMYTPLFTSANRKAARNPRYVYVSDGYGNFVDVFNLRGKLLRKITSGIKNPEGLYVDVKGNLWVANDGSVVMYREGASSPSRTLTTKGAIAGDVTMAPDGTIYVADVVEANGQPGAILVYPPGRNKPTSELQDPQMLQNRYITLDDQGNLFVTTAINNLNAQFVGRVDEYIGAKESGLRNFHLALGAPGGIKWRNGKLYVCDTTRHTIAEYTRGMHPTGRALVTGAGWGGFDISPDGTTFVGADQDNNQGISRAFPAETIVGIYADAAYQGPISAAYQTNQKAR